MTGHEVVITCGSCGSAGVTRDAVVRWNVDAQDWEVSKVFDSGDCDVCGVRHRSKKLRIRSGRRLRAQISGSRCRVTNTRFVPSIHVTRIGERRLLLPTGTKLSPTDADMTVTRKPAITLAP